MKKTRFEWFEYANAQLGIRELGLKKVQRHIYEKEGSFDFKNIKFEWIEGVIAFEWFKFAKHIFTKKCMV